MNASDRVQIHSVFNKLFNCSKTNLGTPNFIFQIVLRFAVLVWIVGLIPTAYTLVAHSDAPTTLMWTWPAAQLADVLLGGLRDTEKLAD